MGSGGKWQGGNPVQPTDQTICTRTISGAPGAQQTCVTQGGLWQTTLDKVKRYQSFALEEASPTLFHVIPAQSPTASIAVIPSIQTRKLRPRRMATCLDHTAHRAGRAFTWTCPSPLVSSLCFLQTGWHDKPRGCSTGLGSPLLPV